LTNRAALDFNLDYRQGFTLLLPHLAPMKRAAQMLSARAVADVHRGDTAAAVARVRTLLALVKGSQDERLVISQLVRIAIAHIGIAANWDLLQSPAVTDDQLAELQRSWSELEFIHAAEGALEFERASTQAELAKMRNSSAAFRQIANGWSGRAAPSGPWYQQAGEMTLMKTKESLWRVAWSYKDELRALHGSQAMLEAVRHAGREHQFAEAMHHQQTELKRLGIAGREDNPSNVLFGSMGDTDMRSLFSDSLMSLDRFIQRLARMEAGRQLLVTALALQRYHLRHGQYPPTLAQLVPEYAASVPRDPIDGQPLRYHLNDDGKFALYSISIDGKDDGGNPVSKENSNSFSWQMGPDLVWPQVASKEQIEEYYRTHANKR
jgi:hypothetical protein